MSATRSTITAVKNQLAALLPSQPGLVGLQVERSYPGDTVQNVSMWLGDVRGTSQIPVARAARMARQEDYMIDLWIQCADPGPDSSGSEDQALAMMGEVEDYLAANPTLGSNGDRTTGLDGVKRAWLESYEMRSGLDPDGRIGFFTSIKLEIGVSARLD